LNTERDVFILSRQSLTVISFATFSLTDSVDWKEGYEATGKVVGMW
jgi:hypothetical protein